MKRCIIAAALLIASAPTFAVDVVHVEDTQAKLVKAMAADFTPETPVAPKTTTVPSNMKIVGYRTETKKYYGWGGGGLGIFGKKKKHYQVPIYELVKDPVSAVPEPSTWMSMTAGLGLIGFMVFRSRRIDN